MLLLETKSVWLMLCGGVPMWQSVAVRWRIWRTTCWSDACNHDTADAAASGGPDDDDGGTLRAALELIDKHKKRKEVSSQQTPDLC